MKPYRKNKTQGFIVGAAAVCLIASAASRALVRSGNVETAPTSDSLSVPPPAISPAGKREVKMPSEVSAVLKRWAETAPGAERNAMLADILNHWIRLDAGSAGAWVEKRLKTGGSLAKELESALLLAFDLDPAGVPDMLELLGGVSCADWLRREALIKIAEYNSDWAMQSMNRLDDEHRLRGLSEISLILARVDPSAGARLYDTLPGCSAVYQAAGELAGRLMGVDPEGALNRMDALPDQWDSRATRKMVETWAEYAPEASLNWMLNTTREIDCADAVFGTVISQWTRADPMSAINWALGQEGAVQQKALAGMVDIITGMNEQAGLKVVLSMSEETLDDATLSRVHNQAILTVARRDAHLASTLAEGTEVTESTRRVIVREWARTDPAATAVWVEKMLNAEGENAPRSSIGQIAWLCSTVAREWMKTDADAARMWCESLPNSSVRARVSELTGITTALPSAM